MTYFEVLAKSQKSGARAGIIHTPHGDIPTPVFMPVGTQATVKGLPVEWLKELGADIVLSNTYHLALRPGTELVQKMGGLHQFMNWDRPILTDSGGFQVFSLSKIRKIVPEGVIFASHIDGSPQKFTPKSVIDHQIRLGSDIMMPLDICSPYPCDPLQLKKDAEQTRIWALEAREYWETTDKTQALFGIVQGGMNLDLRAKCAADLVAMDFPGYALGGVSVGEPMDLLEEQIQFATPLLPEHKPRYVMGIGRPENLDFAVLNGVDMFDCVLPTRLARHAQAMTSLGKLNIRNHRFIEDAGPLDPACSCRVCTTYSRAYLRHLFLAKESLGMILMSYHNVYFLVNRVKKLREGILAGVV
jgi:queuine tRNA-ribosyltransferase